MKKVWFITTVLLVLVGCTDGDSSPPYKKTRRTEIPATAISKPTELDVLQALCRQYDLSPRDGGRKITNVYLRLAAADRVAEKRKLRIRVEIRTSSFTYSGFVPELAQNISANPFPSGDSSSESESPVTSGDPNRNSPPSEATAALWPDSLHIPETIESCEYQVTVVDET